MLLPWGRARTPRAIWSVLIFQLLLLLILLGGVWWIWRSLPEEGVKLHGNANTGVDLLGAREDVWWIAVLGTAVVAGNGVLAWLVAGRERMAALFLLSATLPVLLALLAGVLVVARLNRIV